MNLTQRDTDAVLDIDQRTYSQWLDLIQTCDRDMLIEHANDIRISTILLGTDRPALYKRISFRLGCTSKELLDTLKAEFDAKKDKEAELDDRALAEMTLNENLIFAPDGFYRWRDCGVWSQAHEREIRQRIGDVLKDTGLPVKNRTVSDVLNVLKDSAYSTAVKFDQPQANRVNVLNGTLELEDATWTLRDHQREDYLTSQLPVAYDPEATCPRFDQFLQEVFAGDADASDKALLVQEMLGYSLLQSCRYEKFICLIGSGSNGKSVLLRTLQGLLGSGAYCAVTPSDLSNETSRLMLKGKLANIVPELPAGSMLADDAMKTFTSGEATSAKKLYADKVTFSPFATLWLGTNNLPHSRDLSRGMFRRALLVRFGQSFEGREDVTLVDKLLEELPGILAASCKAYAGVVSRGGFTIPKSCNDELRAWRLSCDQVAEWAEEECTIGTSPGARAVEVSHAKAYEKYRTWAGNMGISHPVSGKEFTSRLQGLGVEKDRITYLGSWVCGFRGLDLNKP